MKVALFIPAFCRAGRGGAEKGAAQLANLLVRTNIDADILHDVRRCCGPSYPIHQGVGLKPIDMYSRRDISALERERYDVLTGFVMPRISPKILEVVDALRVPFILQECNSPRRISSGLFSLTHTACKSPRDAFWFRQAILAHAAAIRFNHPAYASSVLSDISPFTYAFYNSAGRSPDGIDSVRTPLTSVSEPVRKFICVGALRHGVKNGLAAMRAFCDFSRQVPGCSLHLYGANAFVKETAQLREDFPEADIVERGYEKDPVEIYSRAYALVIPSLDEGMPNVLIEAFTYGVPCIGFSDCPGVRDTISHEVNGLLADRNDPDSLTAALRRISDPEFRNELGRNARTFAEENFTYEKWAANWLRMVHNAAQGLNNEGRPQRPAALDPSHSRSSAWGTLLQCHLGRS